MIPKMIFLLSQHSTIEQIRLFLNNDNSVTFDFSNKLESSDIVLVMKVKAGQFQKVQN